MFLLFGTEFSIIPNKLNIDYLLLTIDKGDRKQNGKAEIRESGYQEALLLTNDD